MIRTKSIEEKPEDYSLEEPSDYLNKICKDNLDKIRGCLSVLACYSRIYIGDIFATEKSRKVFLRLSNMFYNDLNFSSNEFCRLYRECIPRARISFEDIEDTNTEEDIEIDKEELRKRTLESRLRDIKLNSKKILKHGRKNFDRPYTFPRNVQDKIERILPIHTWI